MSISVGKPRNTAEPSKSRTEVLRNTSVLMLDRAVAAGEATKLQELEEESQEFMRLNILLVVTSVDGWSTQESI